MPLFGELAEKVCENLQSNIKDNSLLKIAKEKGDYAIIFDLLESDHISGLSTKPKILRKKVINILSDYTGQPEIHEALLELSALPNNTGNRLVTTNFDRLFFEVNKDLKFDSAPKLIPPRKEKWKNLTFLHGVIDEDNDSEGENLILTKTDFGLAYLHDNWASRFIIQLFQDFTVLFIGYSADDPVMNYLVSAISYENKRRRGTEGTGNNKIKPSIYAFVGYKEREKKEDKENKWKSIGVEPISYKVKPEEDHSLLYETVKEWAKLKKTGLAGRRNWLKQQLEKPYREETDREKAETVISSLKMDEKLAEYLPEINLSSDPKKIKPVDISWLKAFSEEEKETANKNQTNNSLILPRQKAQTESSLLEKLTRRTAYSSPHSLWEPLSPVEKNLARWLLHHLDKKKLIHWLIKQAPIQTGLISLHPEFKNMLKGHLKHIQENADEKLDKREALFWDIIITQEDRSNKFNEADSLIHELNEEGYSYFKIRELLSCLDPQIGFETYFFSKELSKIDNCPDLIYEPKLQINTFDHPSFDPLTNQTALLCHVEDWIDLLKKAMELAKRVGLIDENGDDLFYIQRPSIAEHEQNRNDNSWTYLVDLVRDSFNLAMEKDKKMAQFLLLKWQIYPYSLFYRLILYVVTKYSDLSEDTVIKLFEKKPNQTLWSSSCKNEVLKYLGDRQHSESAGKKLLSIIRKGPLKSFFREDIEEKLFVELKERAIYQRLDWLKLSVGQLPEDIEPYYNEIQSKYNILKKRKDSDSFPFYLAGPSVLGSKKLFHNKTNEKVFEIINKTSDNPLTIDERKEEFRSFIKDSPDRAFEILSMFQDNDMNSAPYWSSFISETSMITDAKKSSDYFLKSFKKIESYSDSFFKECLWSLIHGFNMKGGLIYFKDKGRFEKWWKRLWNLSMQEEQNPFTGKSNITSRAINSNLGKLSQTMFRFLPEEGKIPEDIKKYFKTILQSEVIKKDPSVLFHFGSYLSELWHLDREWTIKTIKPLMDWTKTESVFIRKITDPLYSFQSTSNPPEGSKDTSEDYNICDPLWKGYLFDDMFLGPDFLEDFKEEFLNLLLNYKKGFSRDYKTEYQERLSEIFFITTGGMNIKNIFTQQETQKIVQNMNTDILESLSRQIWQLLKNTEKDKSSVLWSEKIKLWIENFWPQQTDKMSHKIAKNLSFVILHCGDKLPEAFSVLKDYIEDIIQQNSNYIAHYIVKDEEDKTINENQQKKENNKQDIEYIYDYPNELLKILNWNFPEDKIYYSYDTKVKKILDKLKAKHPNIEKNEQYHKLIDKITY